MIADTSAWIEYLRATGSRAHRRLRQALVDHEAIVLPHVVLQELLQGARGPQAFRTLHDRLDQLPAFVADDDRELYAMAALLYARGRWTGRTIRSSNDCLIAACAITGDHELLAHDRDFAALAQIDSRLRLV